MDGVQLGSMVLARTLLSDVKFKATLLTATKDGKLAMVHFLSIMRGFTNTEMHRAVKLIHLMYSEEVVECAIDLDTSSEVINGISGISSVPLIFIFNQTVLELDLLGAVDGDKVNELFETVKEAIIKKKKKQENGTGQQSGDAMDNGSGNNSSFGGNASSGMNVSGGNSSFGGNVGSSNNNSFGDGNKIIDATVTEEDRVIQQQPCSECNDSCKSCKNEKAQLMAECNAVNRVHQATKGKLRAACNLETGRLKSEVFKLKKENETVKAVKADLESKKEMLKEAQRQALVVCNERNSAQAKKDVMAEELYKKNQEVKKLVAEVAALQNQLKEKSELVVDLTAFISSSFSESAIITAINLVTDSANVEQGPFNMDANVITSPITTSTPSAKIGESNAKKRRRDEKVDLLEVDEVMQELFSEDGNGSNGGNIVVASGASGLTLTKELVVTGSGDEVEQNPVAVESNVDGEGKGTENEKGDENGRDEDNGNDNLDES